MRQKRIIPWSEPGRAVLVSSLLNDLATEVENMIEVSSYYGDDMINLTFDFVDNLSKSVGPDGPRDKTGVKIAMYIILSEYYRLYSGNLNPDVAQQIKTHAESFMN